MFSETVSNGIVCVHFKQACALLWVECSLLSPIWLLLLRQRQLRLLRQTIRQLGPSDKADSLRVTISSVCHRLIANLLAANLIGRNFSIAATIIGGWANDIGRT